MSACIREHDNMCRQLSCQEKIQNIECDMLEPLDVLKNHRERMPNWLAEHRPEGPFPRKNFFNSRVVYYPCSGTDGHPLRIFGKAHSAHCFVYADWHFVSRDDMRHQLHDPNNKYHPSGYRCITFKELKLTDFIPHDWTPTFPPDKDRMDSPPDGNYVIWAVLEREEELNDDHGPQRLSILQFGYEYVTLFEKLFCLSEGKMAYAILMDQPMGNWTNMGGEHCLMQTLALNSSKGLPRWLFVAEHTKAWPDYIKRSNMDKGGMGRNRRALFITHS